MLGQVCQVAQLHQGQGVAPAKSVRVGAGRCNSLFPASLGGCSRIPCMIWAQARSTDHPQPSTGKQMMIFTCDFYFFLPFVYFFFSFFFLLFQVLAGNNSCCVLTS